ncbi:MAG: formate dehydrogenase accessory sulfurtransferase FdhD [Candidatus Omnitrophica bacterium]|nr:formate dehydrogenase accessory sulfurtransferase FdhD [Candidatus Omnitrophota bacterium]
MEPVKIIKIKKDSKETVEDWVAMEVPFTVNALDKELATLLSTPRHLEDLVRGFLFTSGLINDVEDIETISIDTRCWVADIKLNPLIQEKDMLFRKLYTSGCGGGVLLQNVLKNEESLKISSDIRIRSVDINRMMSDFQKRSEVFLKTGGTHSAALADCKDMLIFREDIGRHNAVDKVIGQALSQQIPFGDKIILTSGRVSTEIIFKMQKCQIPIIVSKSAPTGRAVRLAENFGITLIGFARGQRMNIYSGEERVE